MVLKILLLSLALSHFNSVQSKVVHCRNKFPGGDHPRLWIYCTKFGSGVPNQMQISAKAQLLVPYSKHSGAKYKVEVAWYSDTQFLEIAEDLKMECQEKRSKALGVMQLEVLANGEWGDKRSEDWFNLQIPQIYYFVVLDCDRNLHANERKLPKVVVEFELTNQLTNQKGGELDQFSYEDKGILSLHGYLLIIFLTLFGYNVKSYIQFRKTFDRYDSPHFVILIGLYLQLSAVCLKFLHYWSYSSNGYGLAAFDILSLICQMLAEIGMASLFMLFAYGWTLSFQDIDWDNNLEFYIPVGSIMIALHLVLAAMTYIDFDAYHKYHDFAGVQGFLLILLRVLLFAYYVYCIRQNKATIPRRSQEIYHAFMILGCLYFLIVPGSVLSSYLLPEYSRQYYYCLMSNGAQAITAMIILQQQSSTKTKYFKSSITGAEGILPMQKLR